MSYAVSAVTPDGVINLRSSSVGAIRAALAEAHKDGATKINLTENGTSIDESQLGQSSSSTSTDTASLVKTALLSGTTSTSA